MNHFQAQGVQWLGIVQQNHTDIATSLGKYLGRKPHRVGQHTISDLKIQIGMMDLSLPVIPSNGITRKEPSMGLAQHIMFSNTLALSVVDLFSSY